MMEHDGDVEVARVRRLPLPLKIPIFRGIDHLLQPLVFTEDILFGGFTADVLIYYSPPVPHAFVGLLARVLHGTRVLMNLQDVFPQYAIALGVLRNRTLISVLEAVEQFAYRTADGIVVHSRGHVDWITRNRGVPREKMFAIQNFISADDLAPSAPGLGDPFRELIGARPDDFVVSYAGAMGFPQDLDTLLDAADRLRESRGIRFVLVGAGVHRDRLVERAERMRLPNVQFLPMQSQDLYRGILCGSDACVVTLRREIDTPVVPGKLCHIMAAGRPVIAIVPDVTDAARVVEASGAGIVVPPGGPERLCEAIGELRESPERRELCGIRGRAYALREFDVRVAAARYVKIVTEILREKHSPVPLGERSPVKAW
jgi:putative colanic acid biosynthesis glycosyltransferase WcaI